MRIWILAVGIALIGSAVNAATPSEEAKVKAVLAQLAEIDKEDAAIAANERELNASAALLDEERSSLLLRFPGIQIPPGSDVSAMRKHLRAYRQAQGATVLPIVERDRQLAHERLCAQKAQLEATRAKLEATDGYKRATLEERMELRRAFDNLYAEAGIETESSCQP